MGERADAALLEAMNGKRKKNPEDERDAKVLWARKMECEFGKRSARMWGLYSANVII